MLEKASEIRVLILKHLRGTLTPEENNVLQEWKAASRENRRLFDTFEDEEALTQEMKDYFSFRKEAARRRKEVVVMDRRNTRHTWYKYAAAAVLLIAVSLIAFFLFRVNRAPSLTQTEKWDTAFNKAIQPGKNGAILTLGSGRQIVLDSVANGQLTGEGNATVSRKEGVISYQESNGPDKKVVYHTMSTPKGRQYKLLLSDGTAIWLNAASSVTYPTLFTGNTREISITGEVYLEVATDKQKPFIVQVPGMGKVEVLGTHFAINAYPDELQVKTTLLEGSVRLLVNDNKTYLLQPGQQARCSNDKQVVIRNGNTEEATAFVHGFFYFDKANIKAVMRQLEKWYDIQVSFAEPVSNRTFDGEIERNLTLPVVLNMLEKNGVRFRLEGNRVQVQ
ncbi:FecR family protein [Pseudoflavitalea sp. X16]|uniref:FecR family protein n=1 Tax=Paraflavitalea devenefica TaxID=2716334 RepID=UPI0014244838|nr:FecR family protein [Paraflavitalea devenefica]NII25846.1 FecR family protein [Paraflavitalea devenefica]